MSERADLFLGLIAAATLVMALIQIGVIVVAWRMAKKATDLSERVRQELSPFVGRLEEIASDAQHAVSVAKDGWQRIEHRVASVVDRLDDTVETVQHGVMTPAREGAALVAGARAVLRAFKRPDRSESPH